MILYNGASGGLGRYLAGSLGLADARAHALQSRLEDQSGLEAELSRLDPSPAVTFIHLAARVSVPACEADPSGAYTTNVALAKSTVETVLNWASRHDVNARVIYVSSGHVYAAQPEGTRLAEDAPTLPRSVYAETKRAAEDELVTLASVWGVPIVVALIQRARTGQLAGIPGLDFARDYLDARDVCEDLRLLAAATLPGTPCVVNVCSGVPVRIRELLMNVLTEVAGDRADDLARSATAAPGRSDDVRWLVGDPSRFTAITGSSPQRIPLSKTLADAVTSAA